jgi:hypothetical protein
MSEGRFEAGLKVRRDVLGADYVNKSIENAKTPRTA